MGIRLREIATARRDVATVPRTRLGEAIYVSAKRTHFIDAPYSMHHFYLQKLMSFAMDFANGFVLEKRTHLEGVGGVVFIEKWVLFRKVKPWGIARVTSLPRSGPRWICSASAHLSGSCILQVVLMRCVKYARNRL